MVVSAREPIMHAHSNDPPSPSAAIRSGREALERGAREDARLHFRQALDQGASAEAWEGLGQAAFFLEDVPLLFEARERAYLLYREAGDATAAARMAVLIALDTLDYRAERAVANGWLQRARRL